jgi:hypothetical protein
MFMRSVRDDCISTSATGAYRHHDLVDFRLRSPRDQHVIAFGRQPTTGGSPEPKFSSYAHDNGNWFRHLLLHKVGLHLGGPASFRGERIAPRDLAIIQTVPKAA